MNEYFTTGKQYYQGSEIQVSASDDLFVAAPEEGLNDSFQLLYVEEGSIRLETGSVTKYLIPPIAICVNYRERFEAMEFQNAKGFSIMFKPEVVNHSLVSYKNEAAGTTAEDPAFKANRILINPFLLSSRSNPYYINLEKGLQDRLKELYRNMKNQLDVQPDPFWPCRSRSFFLEILMFVHNLYGIQNGDVAEMTVNESSDPLTRRIINEVQSRYGQSGLSRRGLARELKIGSGELNELVRQTMGSNFKDYLQEVRTTVVSVLARNTILNFREIWIRCGYRSAFAMTGAFRKRFGVTPESYRSAHPDPYG